MWATGRMPAADLGRLRAGEAAFARQIYDTLHELYPREVAYIRSLSGMSRADTCVAVQQALVTPVTGSDDSTALYEGREAAKDVLLTEFTEPIAGTHKLLAAVRGKLKLALATQTDRPTVELLAGRGVIPLDVFDAVVAVGGDPRFAGIAGSKDKKRAAYMAACAELGVLPGRACCVEDSVDGLGAAGSAGLLRLGFQAPDNPQDLVPHADLVLADLAPLADPSLIELVATMPAGEAVRLLRERLAVYVVG
jgi:beta-phosphoglucomutase-like phosphatase (HAD superfamily)